MSAQTNPPVDLSQCLVVASVSGGKDSAALSLWLREQGIEHKRVFADTGWEAEETYRYLRGPLAARLGPIDEVQGRDAGMVNLVRRKGTFPSRMRRFCTEELKVKPLIAYVAALQDAGHEVVNAVGIRAGESKARSKMTEWEWNKEFDCWTWRPLIDWTEQDVIDTHTRNGLAPNPLYLKGAERVGCFPCIFARKSEVKLVADVAPERIKEIRSLERDVSAASAARGSQNAERTFFAGKLTRENKPAPIDQVVEWSRTDHGGKQFFLIEDDPVLFVSLQDKAR
jgi:3'-phosphoadenosine 5'-phosphosulfate sulfotransferase (PAPS reductase)/FAD synthetase